MSKVRKFYSAVFKAQVALSAIREDATMAELTSRYGVHATVIHRWKKEAIESMTAVFLVRSTGKTRIIPLKLKSYMQRLANSRWNVIF